MDAQPVFYRHSGRFSPAGWISAAATSLLPASILAFVYAYGIIYIPLVYGNILLCLAYGFAIGAVASLLLVHFKVRNGPAAYAAVVLAALGGYYLSWAVWIAHHLRGTDLGITAGLLIRKPRAMWALMELMNTTGTWSIGRAASTGAHDSVSGPLLWAVWAGEALIILGTSLWIVRGKMSRPFCEGCDAWCQERKGILTLTATDLEALGGGVLARDWSLLTQAFAPEPSLGTWGRLDLCTCPACPDTNVLTLRRLTRSQDKKGKTETSEHVLINQLLLTREETESLQATCDDLLAASESQAEPSAQTNLPAST
jgi:hypothetical protein